MALYVAVDLSHVVYVVVGVVGLLLAQDLDDLALRLVALGLAAPVALADRLGLVGSFVSTFAPKVPVSSRVPSFSATTLNRKRS